MSRSCWRVLGLLLLMSPLWGCTQAPQPVLADDEYRLRLVFDGLVTVARDQPGKPGQAWVLVGNASHPDQLQVGKKIPPHKSLLLVRVKDEDGTEATVSGRPLGSSSGHGLPGTWKEIELTGEDLSLAEVKTSTKFNLEFDKFRRKQPCNPNRWYFFCWENRSRRQHRNLGWTVDLDDALAKLPGSPHDKGFKKCLTEDDYSCAADPLLLNARLKLDNAEIFVNRFFGERPRVQGDPIEPAKFPRFRMRAAGRNLSQIRAQAQEVGAELIVRKAIEIRSRDLGSGEDMESIRIEGKPGAIVEVRLLNHPKDCTTLAECASLGFTDNDFLFNFNLLNKPDFISMCELPVPVQITDPPPAFNTQCSPASYRP